jgi:hypothetical protein
MIEPEFEFMRLKDIQEPTFDSLEQLCNVYGKVGWQLVSISQGDLYRTATLQRQKSEIITMKAITKREKERIMKQQKENQFIEELGE